MGQIMLDSSVLIALLKESDNHHRKAVNALKGHSGEIAVSVAVISEALVYAFREGEETANRTREAILELVTRVFPIDSRVALEAARLRAKKKLIIGDAFIAATANLQNLPLWTFDKSLSNSIPNARLLK